MDEVNVAEKKVTWVELFFDLVFVFAVTRTSELLQEDHGWTGVLRALVVFVPVYWTWVGTTMHANMHEIDTTRGRLSTFAVGFCGLLMALALPTAWEHGALLLAASYWAARLLLLAAITGLPHRRAFPTFTVAALVTGPLLLAGAFCEGEWRLAVWALAAVIDLSVPWLLRRSLLDAPFHVSHLVERFGTFVIIALGETVVAVGVAAAEHELDAPALAVTAAAFVAICGLWWLYFTYSATAIEDSLEHSSARIEVIRPVLTYGHLLLVAGIIAVAAAIGHAVADPREHLGADTAALLFGGTALCMLTFAANRWRMYRTLAWPRLVLAACCVALAVLGPHLAAVLDIGLLALALVVVNAVEKAVVPHTLVRTPRS